MTFPEAQITPTEHATNCPRCGDGPFDARYPEDAGDLCGCPPQDDDYDGPLDPLDPQGDLHYAYAQRQERLDIAAALPYQQATPGSQNDWHCTFARYRKAGLSVSYAKRKADARLVPAILWRQYRRDHDQQRDRIRKHRAWVALSNLNVCMGCGTFVSACRCLPGKRMCRRCDPLPLTDYPRDALIIGWDPFSLSQAEVLVQTPARYRVIDYGGE